MTFIEDNKEQLITDALLSGQTKLYIDRMEIRLKPLKRDTFLNRERQATVQAQQITKLLN